MTVKNMKMLRGGAYTAPCAEEITIETSHQILEASITLPDVEEVQMDW